MYLSGVALIIGLVSLYFLAEPKSTKANTENKEPLTFADIVKLLKSPTIWLLAISNLFMVGTLEGFADVWGVNYLITAYNLTKSNAAALVSFIFVGMLFGGPMLAFISKRIGNYAAIVLCGIGMAVCLEVLFTVQHLHLYTLATLFFIIGLMCCYQVLVFAVGNDLVSPKMLGLTIAFLNCINMLGGSFFHSVIGLMMDQSWTGSTVNGIRQYTLESYQHALIIIPFFAVMGSLIVMLIGKKAHRITKSYNKKKAQL
jgi:fucose permease